MMINLIDHFGGMFSETSVTDYIVSSLHFILHYPYITAVSGLERTVKAFEVWSPLGR